MLVDRWLEKLMKHFGIRELGETSDQRFAVLVAHYCENDPSFSQTRASLQGKWLQDDSVLSELKCRVVRLAGARLNETFVAMAPDVIDLEDTEQVSVAVDGKTIQSAHYKGEVYRLIETFDHRHRLQAFCLAQTFEEKDTDYLITRSQEAFTVWVNIRSLPNRRETRQLASKPNLNRI